LHCFRAFRCSTKRLTANLARARENNRERSLPFIDVSRLKLTALGRAVFASPTQTARHGNRSDSNIASLAQGRACSRVASIQTFIDSAAWSTRRRRVSRRPR
jgi:hypothetical protein